MVVSAYFSLADPEFVWPKTVTKMLRRKRFFVTTILQIIFNGGNIPQCKRDLLFLAFIINNESYFSYTPTIAFPNDPLPGFTVNFATVINKKPIELEQNKLIYLNLI